MRDYMEELTSEWVGWVRYRDAVQRKVVELIRRTDARFRDDEEGRQREIKTLQKSFYRVAIAEKLVDAAKIRPLSASDALQRADELLEKSGCPSATRGTSSDHRTAEEERFYGTVRVRWSGLLKKARVRAADARGGDTSMYRRS